MVNTWLLLSRSEYVNLNLAIVLFTLQMPELDNGEEMADNKEDTYFRVGDKGNYS